jgi:hypothetical protein
MGSAATAMRSATAARSATTRGCSVGSDTGSARRWFGVRCVITRRCDMRTACGCSAVRSTSATCTYYRCAACTSTIICRATKPARISSPTTTAEAMAAPTVVIAPSRPRAHAQEDAVIKIAGPIVTNGRAGIWCVVVVAIRTSGRRPYVDGNLCVS